LVFLLTYSEYINHLLNFYFASADNSVQNSPQNPHLYQIPHVTPNLRFTSRYQGYPLDSVTNIHFEKCSLNYEKFIRLSSTEREYYNYKCGRSHAFKTLITREGLFYNYSQNSDLTLKETLIKRDEIADFFKSGLVDLNVKIKSQVDFLWNYNFGKAANEHNSFGHSVFMEVGMYHPDTLTYSNGLMASYLNPQKMDANFSKDLLYFLSAKKKGELKYVVMSDGNNTALEMYLHPNSTMSYPYSKSNYLLGYKEKIPCAFSYMIANQQIETDLQAGLIGVDYKSDPDFLRGNYFANMYRRGVYIRKLTIWDQTGEYPILELHVIYHHEFSERISAYQMDLNILGNIISEDYVKSRMEGAYRLHQDLNLVDYPEEAARRLTYKEQW
jgi:hypothetical protein